MYSELDKRMKRYEAISDIRLVRRMPVIIRIDGIAHHTFTRKFKKPFDSIYMGAMQETMKYLCENIQGCVLGYTQSDEITLVLIDYKRLESDAWFDNRVEKMCSAAASMATMEFNRKFKETAEAFLSENEDKDDLWDYCDALAMAINKGAMFDARCFNVPKEDVTNNLYWRQVDAMRNSIQMVGQANFSAKELHNKDRLEIIEMLSEKGIKWDDLATVQKRGCCCVKKAITTESCIRNKWVIDKEIPKFVGDGRKYIDELVMI